jgi:hypothetical protein
MLLKAHVCTYWEKFLAWKHAVFTLFREKLPCSLV